MSKQGIKAERTESCPSLSGKSQIGYEVGTLADKQYSPAGQVSASPAKKGKKDGNKK